MACGCSCLSKHWVCLWVMLHLCSTICDAGDFQVVGPDGPLTAAAGEDLVLPCSLKPSMNAEDMTVEWLRLNDQGQSSVVHLYKDHTDINTKQMPSYRDRTSLFKEELSKGNASLHLKQLRVADTGHFKCLILSKDYDDISIQLTVIKGWFDHLEPLQNRFHIAAGVAVAVAVVLVILILSMLCWCCCCHARFNCCGREGCSY
ncbi:myelin-oligodendrocyte glycoprotein-like [Alosa pseudoharengus]|uniref:myelin-oligodendrocyte glycoprotein-like n=1 Tax=Alosa pseudoharengus TaxID=34774 RepID=UPI003F8A46EC